MVRGYIKPEAQTFLDNHPDQGRLLKSFLHCFNVNFAGKRDAANTCLYTYILEPEDFMKEAFGLEREIFLSYSTYDVMEPRSIQALKKLLQSFPFYNRVDTLNCMFISKDVAVHEWFEPASLDDESTQIIIPFSTDELLKNANDAWFVRNRLRQNFFGVDLFGYTLPLNTDLYFLGRQQIVARYLDSVKRSENRGIFVLRKTGKTSFLFKLQRLIRDQKLGYTYFYDCKSPSYRKMHWYELLEDVCSNIARSLDIDFRSSNNEKSLVKSLSYVLGTASKRNVKVILFFDEIEYISFKAPLDEHWQREYVDFWQTLWSAQSQFRNLTFIISGVNPSVSEIDTVNGIQNPLFGIVQSEYLTGLNNDESRNMVRTLGKRMGLKFDHDALDFLYAQYGGHPMLTKLACSNISRQFEAEDRPININLGTLKNLRDEIETELTYYFWHVVSEINQFYPEEYELFEMLASGQTSDFLEFSQINEFVKHLYSYGLINNSDGMPVINMPVAGRYVAIQFAKKENRTGLFRIMEKGKRRQWIKQRVKLILRDMRQLETNITIQNNTKLFGENSFPEADHFAEISSVENKNDVGNFINICNRCFVESIENYGKSIGSDRYFWNDIASSYKSLFNVLEKIKVYRHSYDHLKLNERIAKKYDEYFREDTEGIVDDNERYFCIQQKILEELFTNIQIELNHFN